MQNTGELRALDSSRLTNSFPGSGHETVTWKVIGLVSCPKRAAGAFCYTVIFHGAWGLGAKELLFCRRPSGFCLLL